jgi:hypothetical protein
VNDQAQTVAPGVLDTLARSDLIVARDGDFIQTGMTPDANRDCTGRICIQLNRPPLRYWPSTSGFRD